MSNNKSEPEIAEYLDATYRFFFIDEKSRRRSDGIVIGFALAFALYVYFLLGWPERQIGVWLIVIVVGLNAFATIVYWLWPVLSDSTRTASERVQSLTAVLPSSTARMLGALAVIFLVIANQLPLDAIEPAIAIHRLEKTDIGVVPEVTVGLRNTPLQTRFEQATKVLTESLAAEKPADGDALSKTLDNMTAALQDLRLPQPVTAAASGEIATLNGYLNFKQMQTTPDRAIWRPTPTESTIVTPPTRPNQALEILGAGPDKSVLLLRGTSPPGSPPTHALFGGPVFLSNVGFRTLGASAYLTQQGANWTALNVVVSGFYQNLEGATLLNVTFNNCVIIYSGGPTYLNNVRFIHCQFRLGSDETSQRLRQLVESANKNPIAFSPHL